MEKRSICVMYYMNWKEVSKMQRYVKDGKERVNMHLESDIMDYIRHKSIDRHISIGDYVSSALRVYIERVEGDRLPRQTASRKA